MKSKLTTLLLCIFLGYLGIHRFYLGKWFTGILYLCTGGFAFVGVIIDLILIITGAMRDVDGRDLI
jgi:TM2 domain-containing membrane protein YozV